MSKSAKDRCYSLTTLLRIVLLFTTNLVFLVACIPVTFNIPIPDLATVVSPNFPPSTVPTTSILLNQIDHRATPDLVLASGGILYIHSNYLENGTIIEIVIAKVNPDGIVAWKRSVQLPKRLNYFNKKINTSVYEDSIGDLYIYLTALGYDYQVSGYQVARKLAKLDAVGTVLWERGLQNNESNEIKGKILGVLLDGTILIEDSMQSYGFQRFSQYDADGNQVWQFGSQDLLATMGGVDTWVINMQQVRINNEGEIVALAKNSIANNSNELNPPPILFKLDPLGNIVWVNSAIEVPFSMDLDLAGNVYLHAANQQGVSSLTLFNNMNGTVVWNQPLSNNYDNGYGLADNDGNYLIVSNRSVTTSATKLDSNGQTLWETSLEVPSYDPIHYNATRHKPLVNMQGTLSLAENYTHRHSVKYSIAENTLVVFYPFYAYANMLSCMGVAGCPPKDDNVSCNIVYCIITQPARTYVNTYENGNFTTVYSVSKDGNTLPPKHAVHQTLQPIGVDLTNHLYLAGNLHIGWSEISGYKSSKSFQFVRF